MKTSIEIFYIATIRYLLFILLRLSIIQGETGNNVRQETIHGLKVKFQWYFNIATINNYKDAEKYCQNKKLHLVYSENLKYFYKTLQPTSMIKGKNENIQFYINDVLESTLDYPSHESGEKMCMIIEKQLNSNLMNTVKVNAANSCSRKVNTVVCSNSPIRYANVVPFKVKKSQFCLSTNICYIIIGCTCGIIVILGIVVINLCMRKNNSNLNAARSMAPFKTQQISHPNIGSPTTQYDLERLNSSHSPLLQLMPSPNQIRYTQSPRMKRRVRSRNNSSNSVLHNSRGYNSDGATKINNLDSSSGGETKRVICKHSFE